MPNRRFGVLEAEKGRFPRPFEEQLIRDPMVDSRCAALHVAALLLHLVTCALERVLCPVTEVFGSAFHPFARVLELVAVVLRALLHPLRRAPEVVLSREVVGCI